MELAQCQQVVLANPNDCEAHYALGKALAEQQDWESAILAYGKAVELQPDFAVAYHHWGDALINLQRWEKAVTIYEQAIGLAPDFSWSYHNLGVAYFNLKKIQKAIFYYSEALKLDGNNPQFYYSLGQGLACKGLIAEAVDNYEQAINLGWHKWRTYHEYGDLLVNLKRYDESIGAYQKAIKLKDDFPWSYHNLGVALFHLQLFLEAIPFFEKAITIDSNFVSAYYYSGAILALQEDWDNAIASYRQAITLNPDFPGLQSRLAHALEARSRLDLTSALNIYHCLLKEDEGQSYYKIAQILTNQNKLEQALVYARSACKLEPENSAYQDLLDFLCQQRSKLYEPSYQFAIADHSYALWSKSHSPKLEDFQQMCAKLGDLKATPTISIILPLKESAVVWIENAIAAIQAQVYPYWELCLGIATILEESDTWLIGEKKSELETILQPYIEKDLRIKVSTCSVKTDLSDCAQVALELATGDFIALLKEETLLSPDALLECGLKLAQDTTIDILYGDEDFLKGVTWGDRVEGLLTQPWFKPDWCPDLLLSCNYFRSLVLFRHSLLKEAQGFNSGFNREYIYDLSLRLTEITDKVAHLPKILAHCHHSSEFDESEKTQAVMNALHRRKEAGKVITNLDFPHIQTIRYEIKEKSLVSIIILTRNLGKILNQCLESIFTLTTYPHYEVILVDNDSNEPETLEIIAHWEQQQPEKLRTLKLDIPFNYSQLNNLAVQKSSGKYLLFLNNDTKIISPDWIEAMVEQAQRKAIAAVGALLLYPDDTIQHAGVVLGITGIAGHSHRGFSVKDSGYNGTLVTTTNYSAVTAACLMCRREVFQEVGGFNEELAVAYNDVDFCLKLKQQGYYNVLLPHVRLYHYESLSRKQEEQLSIQQEVAYMEATWNEIIKRDPCYNVNLTREKEDYSLNLKPEAEITAIFLREVAEGTLWGFFLDEPKPGCVKRNSLDIIGWVVGKVADAIAIAVICQNKIIATAEISQNRPDVAQVYPQLPQAVNSGFETTINLLDLPQNAELYVEVVLANETKIKLGKIQLSM